VTQGKALFTQPSGGPVPSRPLRVLIVEDEKDTVLTLMLLLATEGHDAKGVGTAAAAWQLMREFAPDVVLLDVGLPDKSGYEVARELRVSFGLERPVIIALTAWNKGSDKILAHLVGCDHHLGKPYDPQALLALLAPLTLGL
jgi:DNA-binding response OmpR family regulator